MFILTLIAVVPEYTRSAMPSPLMSIEGGGKAPAMPVLLATNDEVVLSQRYVHRTPLTLVRIADLPVGKNRSIEMLPVMPVLIGAENPEFVLKVTFQLDPFQ